MLMVIFGAGASYDLDRRQLPTRDAVDTRFALARPPLASQLFDQRFAEIVSRYPASRALMPRLWSAQNVEAELEAIRAEGRLDGGRRQPHVTRQLAAIRYYLGEVVSSRESLWRKVQPDGVTNYVELMESIEEWRIRTGEAVCLVTFNYDTLLEDACQSVVGGRFRLKEIRDYIGNEAAAIFKLHGSTNWSQELRGLPVEIPDGPDRDAALIDAAAFAEPTGRYFGGYGSHDVTGWGPYWPAIAIPMVSKSGDNFTCPHEQIDALQRLMPYVTHLLIVGWRAQEGHFHQLWRNATGMTRPPLNRRLVRTLVVDANEQSAEAILDTLKGAMGVGDTDAKASTSEGFSGFVASKGLSAFIA